MDYDEFLTKQKEIYDKNKTQDANLVRTQGVKSGFKDQGGYLIILRHPLEVTEPIEKFTSRIADVIPCIPYGSHNLHTTISDYKIENLNKFSPDENILKKLAKGAEFEVGRLTPDLSDRVSNNISFIYPSKNWLYNQTVVLLGGIPNPEFVSFTNNIISASKELGIELRMPWGAHMTAARFTQTKTPVELTDFFNLMKEAPQIPDSNPTAIDVGYFKMSERGLDLTIYERFKLE